MARLAFVSPVPPAETGIASYSAAVLTALEHEGVAGGHEIDVVWPVGRDALERVRRADLAIYHVGNNAMFHRDIYRLAVEQPGVVVLHDLALDDLIRSFVMDG